MFGLIKSFSRAALLALGLGAGAYADDIAGEFDYYVLSLSWSSAWCALEGDDRNSPQCDPSHDYGFVLHGLWPQYETGWPAQCRSSFRDPSRATTAAMADIMGSGGSAWHQWKKHGRCSGLSADDYYALAREAYGRVNRPEILRQITDEMALAPKVVEAAFLEVNDRLDADAITITCKKGHIQEARICLTRDLEFRDCGRDVIRDCSASSARFLPVR